MSVRAHTHFHSIFFMDGNGREVKGGPSATHKDKTHKEIFSTNIHNFKEVPFINFVIVIRVIIISMAPNTKRPLTNTDNHTRTHDSGSRSSSNNSFLRPQLACFDFTSPFDSLHLRCRVCIGFFILSNFNMVAMCLCVCCGFYLFGSYNNL